MSIARKYDQSHFAAVLVRNFDTFCTTYDITKAVRNVPDYVLKQTRTHRVDNRRDAQGLQCVTPVLNRSEIVAYEGELTRFNGWDHDEVFANRAGDYIVVLSPYVAEQKRAFLEGIGWTVIPGIYSDGDISFVKIVSKRRHTRTASDI